MAMQRTMLKSKLHRVTVTDSNLDYEGSVAIDSALMKAASILPYEKVEIYNVTNGNRFQTYAITAPEGSGDIVINGAAAHLAKAGDIAIIATYAEADEAECASWQPVLVYVDARNAIKDIKGNMALRAAANARGVR